MRDVDPKEFWENKILGWEDGRYKETTSGSILERFADRSSESLRFRQTAALKLLSPFVSGKRLVEIGCGSGLLAEKFVAMGVKSYRGYDIAENAIDRARASAKVSGIDGPATFETASVEAMKPLDVDIVFSLGLLDWLDDQALSRLFQVVGTADWLHAFSEKRISVAQYAHRLYVFLAYGHRTGGYVPRYHSFEQIKGLAQEHQSNKMHVYRNPRLAFGAFATSLPVDIR